MPTPTPTLYVPYQAIDDLIMRGTRAAQPSAVSVVPGAIYFVTNEDKLERSNGTTWEIYSAPPGGDGGSLTPHHLTHESGGTDVVTLAQSQITNLTTDLAAKVSTTDPRLTDARTPIAHHTTHEVGGSDVVVIAQSQVIGLSTSLTAKADKPVPIGDGGTGVATGLTQLNANNLTSGTVPDARLSSNVQMKPITIGDLPSHAGTNKQVTFNDNGVAAGDAGLTFDKTTDTLSTGPVAASGNVIITKAQPELTLADGVNLNKSHIMGTGDTSQLAANVYHNGAAYVRDDTSKPGTFIRIATALPNIFSVHTFRQTDGVNVQVFGIESSGLMDLRSGQIRFPTTQVPSTDPYIMDDYREGTWTPTLFTSGGQSGQVYTRNLGTYIKIGRQVTVQCEIVLSTRGTLATGVQVSGLPFPAYTPAGGTWSYTCVVYFNNFATNWYSMIGRLFNGVSEVLLSGVKVAAITNGTQVLEADLANNSSFYFSLNYITAN